MVDAAVAAAAVCLWLLVAAKAVGTVRSGSASARWLLATFAFLALGITVFVPAVQTWLAGAVPVDQLKEPLARTAVLAAAFCGQTLLALTGDPISPSARRRRWVMLATAVLVMWLMFVLRPPSVPFGSHPVAEPSLTLFMLAFLTYLAYAVATVMTGCWRYARSASGAMGCGLRLVAAGCLGCLAYVAVTVMAIAMFAVGLPTPPALESSLAQGFVAGGALLVAVGSAATSVNERLVELSAWSHDYVAHRRLYLLWADLVAALPAVALDPPAGPVRDAVRAGHMHLRLYRRLIELRDVWLALHPYVDAGTAQAAERMAGQQHVPALQQAALAEAQVMRAGVAAHAAQRLAECPSSQQAPEHGLMADELAWWLAVAAAWGRPSAGSAHPSRPRVEVGAR